MPISQDFLRSTQQAREGNLRHRPPLDDTPSLVSPKPSEQMPLRACDACKGRKVKCDGSESTEPCSNCRMSDLPCSYLQLPKKRGPRPYERIRRLRTTRGSRQASLEGILKHDSSRMHISPSAGTPLSLDPAYAISPDNDTPPWMVSTPQSVLHQTSTNVRVQVIHQDLVLALESCLPNLSLEQIITNCMDCFMQNLLPLAPLLHEASLRSNLRLDAPLAALNAEITYSVERPYSQLSHVEDVAMLRSYTLTTALCSSAAFLLPPEKVPNGGHVGQLFLRASREILKLYQDLDINHPSSSSILIRIFHAGVLHTDGKARLASQVFREALGLVVEMRLYEERSFDELDPIEARLCRMAFWQVYMMDIYMALFEDRPMVLHEFFLDGFLTTKCPGGSEMRLIDLRTGSTPAEFEEQLLAGFYICQQLWATASEVHLDLQTLYRFCRRAETALVFVEAQRINLTGTYLRFLSVLDNIPTFLLTPEAIMSVNEPETRNRRQHFWVQRANLLVTYHCLKMIFLQRFTNLGLASLLGLDGDKVMLALRKTEIAHELISALTSIPFHSLRANGEACVTKIRRVGAALLEVMQQTDAPQVASRAKSLFPLLLDVLAKLDSRASDELNKEYIL